MSSSSYEIKSNPIQSNPWMDPIHVQLWSVQEQFSYYGHVTDYFVQLAY